MALRTWDTDTIGRQLAQSDVAETNPVGGVVMAFARWQDAKDNPAGLQAKHDLDHRLDTLEPQEWDTLKDLVGVIDNDVLMGVMRYSARRALDDGKERLVALKQQPDQEREPGRSKTKPKQRDRER